MDDIAATGAACWNCGETDAHFEEQGVRVAVWCYECGVRGAWAPTAEEALEQWRHIAKTMAEKARTGSIEMLAGTMNRTCAFRDTCIAPDSGDAPGVCCAWEICRVLQAREKAGQKTGMIGGGTYTIIDPGEKPAEADHKIAEAARVVYDKCPYHPKGPCTATCCPYRRPCEVILAQNSPQKPLDTGKGEG